MGQKGLPGWPCHWQEVTGSRHYGFSGRLRFGKRMRESTTGLSLVGQREFASLIRRELSLKGGVRRNASVKGNCFLNGSKIRVISAYSNRNLPTNELMPWPTVLEKNLCTTRANAKFLQCVTVAGQGSLKLASRSNFAYSCRSLLFNPCENL